MYVVNTVCEVCCTITARYNEIGANDIISQKHFPRTTCLIEYQFNK